MTIDFYEWGALLLAVAFFALLYYLKKKRNVNFGLRTILALGLGIVVGLVFKGHYTYVAAFGTIYMHVISAIVIPLLIFSITATITATAVFAAAGLPVEVIVLLSPISSIVDMARTATNVVGAATATTLVAATEEGQLDRDVYNEVREIPEDAEAAVQPA